MSTATLDRPTVTRSALPRPSMLRLTLVELRKMSDTRAGYWLLGITGLLTVGVAILAALLIDGEDETLRNVFAVALQPASILMPVVGILLVTSEWSQRTAMVTFTLVPARQRVLGAKLLAGLALSVIAFVVSLAVALIVSVSFGYDLSMTGQLYGQALISVLIGMVGGIAFGAAILASAPAIVLSYVLPTAWAALGAIRALHGVARWLDQTQTLAPLLEEHLSGIQWARLATSLAVWLLLPLLIGAWRIARSDPR